MKFWSLLICVILTLGLSLAGCQKPTELTSKVSEEEGDSHTDADGKKHDHKDHKHDKKAPVLFPPRENVKDFSGHWGFVIIERQQENAPPMEFTLVLLEVDGSKSENPASLVEGVPKIAEDLQLKESSIKEDEITLNFVEKDVPSSFKGKLREGRVYGTFSHHGGVLTPGYLLPTTAKALKGLPTQIPCTGIEEFIKEARTGSPASLLAYVAKNKSHPFSKTIYEDMINGMAAQPKIRPKSAADLEQVFKDYVEASATWGPQMAGSAYARLANVAVEKRWELERVAGFVKEAESLFGTTSDPNLKAMRDYSTILIALENAWSDDEAKRAASLKSLQDIYDEQSENPLVLLGLAEAAEREKRVDDAIRYYSDLVALPQLEGSAIQERNRRAPGSPTPRQSLTAIWKTKHGDTDQLDKALEKHYETRLHELFAKAHAAKPLPEEVAKGTRVSLLELFTGSQCPPCVGPDLAVSGMLQTFSRTKVITLQYHMNIPRPDPLANEDAVTRYRYYVAASQGDSTPLLLLDGQAMAAGGYMMQTRALYHSLREVTVKNISEESPIRIELTAAHQKDVVTINVNAKNLPEADAEHLRLRLVLVEDAIHFTAPNGIRSHEMVVRSLVGGKNGLKKPWSGEFTINLADLRKQLDEEIAKTERTNHFPFPDRPLDLKKLSVVAWVQNDETKKVLQALHAPVTGGAPAAAEKPAEKTTAEPKKSEAK